MKKVVIVLIAALVCFESFAQETLKGCWTHSEKVLGMTVTEVMNFDSELAGNVESKAIISLAMNILGTKIDGEMEMTVKGAFDYKDGQLVIRWDRDIIQINTTKPITCSTKGEDASDMSAEFEKAMTEILDDMRNDLPEEEIYESVKFKKGKLTLTHIDEKGKKQSETYTFVK